MNLQEYVALFILAWRVIIYKLIKCYMSFQVINSKNFCENEWHALAINTT